MKNHYNPGTASAISSPQPSCNTVHSFSANAQPMRELKKDSGGSSRELQFVADSDSIVERMAMERILELSASDLVELLRNRAALSDSNIGNEVGSASGAVYRIRKRQRIPSEETWRKLAKLAVQLGVL